PVALSHPAKLSPEAHTNLKTSLEEQHSGAENTGGWLILEEGMTANAVGLSATDLQFIETRQFQVVDIARIFGVPPHMIGAIEKTTSFGQGIEQQTIGFVQFTMQPWFTSWEQAICRDLISEAEADTIYPSFRVAALMRGAAKDRGQFYSQALGAGGSPAWMTQNEVRELEDLNRSEDPDADKLSRGSSGAGGGAVDTAADPREGQDEQAQPS